MKKISLTIYLTIFISSVLLFINSFDISRPKSLRSVYGPRIFPQILLVSIIILISYVIYKEFIKAREKQDIKSEKIEEKIYKNKSRFLQTVFITIVFAILFDWLGGIPSIFIFVLAFTWVWKVRNAIILILFPFLVTTGIYYLFHVLLSVRFPRGIGII